MSKPVVLIVDDVPSNIKVLANCLKDHYRIKVATGGNDCLKLAVADPVPDLVLLDIEMPDMGGYEVCQKLQGQPHTQDIPIIFVTARDADRNEELGLQLGAVDYIAKPVRPSIVLARVNTHVTLKQQRDLLKEIALKDQLTGLYNRYYLLETAEQRLAHTERHSDPLSVMLLDLDYFKQVNDTHGHLVGDKVLREFGDLLGRICRKDDIPARFGGEEFVVLLGHCDLEAGVEKAEEVRERVEQLKPEGLDITVSIGVVQFYPGESIEQLLDRADKALYKAKDEGRNCVVSE
ncbi:diguanylate cyclase [Neptuniibacter sp. SY11_33]|uniref:diguanylate cyclase n=1 Tax=Neptuniibacter sp. SY11_33 TaxID=3398215 RepID=UPI0039F639F8